MSMTERLALTAARHPWRLIAAWLVTLVVAIGLVGALLSGRLTTEGEVTNNPDSLRASNLLFERFPQREVSDEVVVVRSPTLTVDNPAFRRRVEGLVQQGRRDKVIHDARTFSATQDRTLVSPDRHAMLLPITLGPTDPSDGIEDVIAAVERSDADPRFEAAVTGTYTTEHDFNELSQSDLENGELKFGLPAALLVLIIVFGALVSAFLPLLLAIGSIIVAIGLTALVAQGWELSVFVVNMITGMGLALGIDYALFVVSRFREERVAGRDKEAAIGAVGATASRAVLFSGSAYVIAMLGLLLVPSTIMRSLAAGAILVGVVSVAAALTLLPAIPVVTLNIGAAGVETMPDRLTTKKGLVAVARSFPTAGAEPALVVVDGPVSSPEVRRAIVKLRTGLARDPAYGRPTLEANAPGNLGVLKVPIGADPLSDQAVDDVRRLRDDAIPAAFAGVGSAKVYVGGTTAENIDYFDVMQTWLPIVIAFVLALSFLLLTVAFRSVVVSATAIALNLLSVGAAYGLLVLVFQHGVGAGLLGFTQVDTIEAWVPLFLFAVLFGLSMDYQVFLLSRIRERYTRTGDTRESVVWGIGSTARIITGAALIIVAVFLGFAQGDLVMFQQMGFGVAVALLIDATIVRSVLVPAAMHLLGRWNWYLPSWLGWMPRLEIEGEEAPAHPAAPTA